MEGLSGAALLAATRSRCRAATCRIYPLYDYPL